MTERQPVPKQPYEALQIRFVESCSIQRLGDLTFMLQGGFHVEVSHAPARAATAERPASQSLLSIQTSQYSPGRQPSPFERLGSLVVREDGSTTSTGTINAPDTLLPWLADQMDYINPRNVFVDSNSPFYAPDKSDQLQKINEYINMYIGYVTTSLEAFRTRQAASSEGDQSSSS